MKVALYAWYRRVWGYRMPAIVWRDNGKPDSKAFTFFLRRLPRKALIDLRQSIDEAIAAKV